MLHHLDQFLLVSGYLEQQQRVNKLRGAARRRHSQVGWVSSGRSAWPLPQDSSSCVHLHSDTRTGGETSPQCWEAAARLYLADYGIHTIRPWGKGKAAAFTNHFLINPTDHAQNCVVVSRRRLEGRRKKKLTRGSLPGHQEKQAPASVPALRPHISSAPRSRTWLSSGPPLVSWARSHFRRVEAFLDRPGFYFWNWSPGKRIKRERKSAIRLRGGGCC